MAIKTISTLKTDVANVLNDNTVEDITPADVRTSVIDTIDSVVAVSLQKSNNLSDLANVATARTNLGNVPTSNITGIPGADIVTNIVSLTQAEYDAIPTKNASTFYVIVG